jgi:hypothetical protein
VHLSANNIKTGGFMKKPTRSRKMLTEIIVSDLLGRPLKGTRKTFSNKFGCMAHLEEVAAKIAAAENQGLKVNIFELGDEIIVSIPRKDKVEFIVTRIRY